ncbi:MAG: hypothetical protein LIP77_03430 [Planctomycetes bacterium]|nr:hypothetical protein [Planctomycetota bacterium]
MGDRFRRLVRTLTPPRARFVLTADALRLLQVTRYWPPWRRTVDETVFFWRDIATVTAHKLDRLTTDAIGLVFQHRDGGSIVMTEDDTDCIQAEGMESGDFQTVAAVFLPRVLPGIRSGAEWYPVLAAGPAFQDAPIVVYTRHQDPE